HSSSTFSLSCPPRHRPPPSFPTRRSSDLTCHRHCHRPDTQDRNGARGVDAQGNTDKAISMDRHLTSSHHLPNTIKRGICSAYPRSEEHTSELQSRENLVCRLLLEKKKKNM